MGLHIWSNRIVDDMTMDKELSKKLYNATVQRNYISGGADLCF